MSPAPAAAAAAAAAARAPGPEDAKLADVRRALDEQLAEEALAEEGGADEVLPIPPPEGNACPAVDQHGRYD
jgi:hypothetical protein